MKKEFFDLINFLHEHGVATYPISDGSGWYAIWVHLAAAMRVCRYRGTWGCTDPRSYVETQRMLIGGKLAAAVEMLDFARFIAPYCEEPVARDFGIAYINGAFIEPHKTGRVQWQPELNDIMGVLDDLETREQRIAESNESAPALGALLSLPDARFDVIDGRPAVVIGEDVVDFSHPESAVKLFLKLHPEWSGDTWFDAKGHREFTPQMMLALSKLIEQWSRCPAPPEMKALQRQLTQGILASGKGFGPRAERKPRHS